MYKVFFIVYINYNQYNIIINNRVKDMKDNNLTKFMIETFRLSLSYFDFFKDKILF